MSYQQDYSKKKNLLGVEAGKEIEGDFDMDEKIDCMIMQEEFEEKEMTKLFHIKMCIGTVSTP